MIESEQEMVASEVFASADTFCSRVMPGNGYPCGGRRAQVRRV
jgi:hypothetical protein